eukprot:209921_1
MAESQEKIDYEEQKDDKTTTNKMPEAKRREPPKEADDSKPSILDSSIGESYYKLTHATLCCLLTSMLLLIGAYNSFDKAPFYGAPTDHCIFSNASTALVDCRTHVGSGKTVITRCDGLKRIFYYNTTGSTCAAYVLYAYGECECDGQPAMTPLPGHGYQSPDKCWIIGCQSDEEWTFEEPQNATAWAWICLVLGMICIMCGCCVCCKCLQGRLKGGSPLVEEIGEKEAYHRFFEHMDSAKQNKNAPPQWRRLQIVAISASVATPVIMIGAFILATFSYGANLKDNTISTGIQYRRGRTAMFQFTEAMTYLSVCCASFVSWIRQAQISIYFKEYATFFGARGVRLYRWLNVLAMFFNVIGYLAITQLVTMDSARFVDLHALWAGIAFLCTASFLFLATVVTIKQRHIEYRRNRLVDGQDAWKACLNTFWYDAILMIILLIAGVVALFMFIGEIIKARKVWDAVPEDERSNVFSYITAFTGEWVSFFCLVSGVATLSLSFAHDHVAWEVHQYMTQEVIYWPYAGSGICLFGICCCGCCCCEIDMLGEMVKEVEEAAKKKNDEKESDIEKELETQNDLMIVRSTSHELVSMETQNDAIKMNEMIEKQPEINQIN